MLPHIESRSPPSCRWVVSLLGARAVVFNWGRDGYDATLANRESDGGSVEGAARRQAGDGREGWKAIGMYGLYMESRR